MPGMSVLHAFYTAADAVSKKKFHKKIAVDIVFQRKKTELKLSKRLESYEQ
jgi:hypothetical protein